MKLWARGYSGGNLRLGDILAVGQVDRSTCRKKTVRQQPTQLLPGDAGAVLGDDIGLSPDEIGMIERVGACAGGGGAALRASLGSSCLLGSQCIVIAHHYLDALHSCPDRLWEPLAPEVTKLGRQQRKKHQRKRRSSAAEAVSESPIDTHTYASSNGDVASY